jgi:hypothetical protein
MTISSIVWYGIIWATATGRRAMGGILRLLLGIGEKNKLNLVQVQKWSSALEKTTDFELDLV